MGLETESRKFESAILVLREFVTSCVCTCRPGNGTEEACAAIEVLQELYNIHSTTITHLQKTLKQHAPDVDLLDKEVVIKKEVDYDGGTSPKIQDYKDDNHFFDDFNYTDGVDYFGGDKSKTEDSSEYVKTKKKNRKKKEKDKIKRIKKSKTPEEKKLKLKKKMLKKALKEMSIIKTENDIVENVTDEKMKTVLKPVRAKRKKDKDGLTKTAKAKMLLNKKRQDRDEHCKIFGKKHVCDICNKNFVIKVFLEKHILKEHGLQKKEVQWECDECGRFYASKRQLERHKMIHRGEKSFQCEICGRGFDTYDTRYIHQFVHMDNKYICDYCGKVYRQRRHLVQHMKNHNGYVWKCKDCGKVFDTQRKWLYHKKIHSGNVKKKQCDICGATFAASSSIRNHMMIHLGHKPYQCSQCDMSFVQAGGLRTHEKTHNNTSRSHRCELCGKMMTSKGLAYHLMVHEGSRPYKCDKCSKAFVTDFKLRKHKKIHLRLGHYKSEEEAGILKPKRKSSSCLPKEEQRSSPQQQHVSPPKEELPQQPHIPPPIVYPSISATLPTNNIHSAH